MNIKGPKTKKKAYIIEGIILLLAVAAYLGVAYKKDFWPFNNAVEQTMQRDTVNESPKNNNTVKKSEAKPNVNEDKTSDKVPIAKGFVATITRLDQTDNQVHFSAKIDNSPSVGTCVITFSNPNDRPITKQVSATIENGTALCGPLAVPALEFSYMGEWGVSLRYYVGNEQVIAQSKVTIK